jgi:hypothetical protein
LLLCVGGASGQVCHLLEDDYKFLVVSSLHTFDNLLDQVGIVSLQFGVFKSNIRGFANFLMSLTEMGLESKPSLLVSREAIPLCDGYFEMTGLGLNNVGLGNCLSLRNREVG